MTIRLFIPILAVLPIFGKAIANETSSFYIKEALVHHLKPTEKKFETPVIMVPGHNLSSYLYLTTPDGASGWAQHFADVGYEVFVINNPKFDFSRGFSVPGFTDVPTEGAPPANLAAKQGWTQDIWRRWGFGPSEGNPYPDSRFPTDDFDEFEANYPYLSKSSFSFGEAVTALLEQAGTSILMAHSAGGPQALTAAKAHPDLVAALVLVEPTGPPTEANFPTFAGMSMLGVYADYVDSRNQTNRKVAVEAAAELFEANGGTGEVISLPEDYGINGNSHIMMQAKNNDFISGLMLDWLEAHAKAPEGGGGRGGKGKGGDRPDAPGGGKGGKGKGGRGGMVDSIFATLDENENGTLNLAEFSKGRRYRGASATERRKAFAEADKDGDGQISPEEMNSGFSGRGSGKGGRKGGKRGL